MSVVSASDNLTDEPLQTVEMDVLTDTPQVGNFTALRTYINEHYSDGIITLDKNYVYNSSTDSGDAIVIDHTVTINGNNYTIDGNDEISTIFQITKPNVVLNNITFTKAKEHCIYVTGSNCTINNSYFINNNHIDGSIISFDASNQKIYNSYFINNTVYKKSQFIVVCSKNGVIMNSYFYNNTVTNGSIVGSGINGTVNGYFRNNKVVNGTIVNWIGVNGTLKGSYFENNSLSGSGASIVLWKGVNGTILDSHFNNNPNIQANIIKIIYEASDMNISGSYFVNNTNLSTSLISWESHRGTISNSYFINNSANVNRGGCINWASKNATIVGSYFINNSIANGDGGAIFWNGANGRLLDSQFVNNSINNGNGGAIHWEGQNGTINNTKFIENHASWNSSSTKTYGGAIYVNGNNTSITNTVFDRNYLNAINYDSATSDAAIKDSYEASGNGGALYVNGDNVTADCCNFTNNHAYRNGAGIYWNGRYNGTLTNSRFINNSAELEGGALKWHPHNGGAGLLENLTFIDNVAVKGGAIYFSHWVCGAVLNNSYFKGNNATWGSAIYRNDHAVSYPDDTKVIDSAVYINNATFIYNQANSSSIKIVNKDGNFNATLYGNDNILNAIYNLGETKYIFINGTNPALPVDDNKDPGLLYQDAREFNQSMIVEILDEEDNVLYSDETLITDIYGQVNFTAYNGKKIRFTHLNDVYYTLMSNNRNIPEIIIMSEGNTTYPGEDVIIPIALYYKDSGNNLTEGNVTVEVGTSKITVPAGTKNVTVVAPDVSGDYQIKLTYTDPYGINLTNTSTLHVLKRFISVNITVDDVYYPETAHAIVKANVTGSYTIKVNGTDIKIHRVLDSLE